MILLSACAVTGSRCFPFIQSSTQDSRDFSRERNVQNKLVFNMGLKPVLKIEPPADRRAAQRETHRVRRAARARSEIAIYLISQNLFRLLNPCV